MLYLSYASPRGGSVFSILFLVVALAQLLLFAGFVRRLTVRFQPAESRPRPS